MDELGNTFYTDNGYALYVWHWIQYSGDSEIVHKSKYYEVIIC